MPDGVFSHLFDDGFEVGRALVLNEHIKAVGFTGSLSGGRALFDLANTRREPIPVYAEMGSLNPMFLLKIMKDQVVLWAKHIATSIKSDSGQFCTKPGLLFLLEDEVSGDFVRELKGEISTAVASTMLSKQINQGMKEKVARLAAAYRVVSQGIENHGSENDGIPVLFELNAEDFLQNSEVHEEIFGPVAVLVRCKTKHDILSCAERLSGQLTASIVGKNAAFDNLCLILREKVGRLVLNGVTTGVRVCPSMNHGGPYPASTDAGSTAVGIDAIRRFSRFLTYQNFDQELLPLELRNENELKLTRRVNGECTKVSI
jgi:NADP-dependent aldehyde dehydrogenase